MKSVFPALGVSVICVVFAGSASAATIVGVANITGSVTVGASTIMFQPTFTAQSTQTGSFLGETGGTILSSLTAPVNTPIDILDFATFNGGAVSPIYFDLTDIMPGIGNNTNCTTNVNAIGAPCTPPGSPFTLTQDVLPSGTTAGVVDVKLNLLGVSGSSDPATGGSPTTAGFTTQIVLSGTTVSSILATLSSPGGTVTSSYSATFSAVAPVTTPEPGTEALFGVGLIGLSFLGRRRLRRN